MLIPMSPIDRMPILANGDAIIQVKNSKIRQEVVVRLLN
jgi:hypothetical protein